MKRQISSSVRCDTFRSLHFWNFLQNSRSSFSTTTRRRVRIHRPSSLVTHVADFNVRQQPSFQSSQLLQQKYLNGNRQIRVLSLSMSTDDDSGEAKTEAILRDIIRRDEAIHQTSELEIQELPETRPHYFESPSNDLNHTAECLEIESSEMLPNYDNNRYTMDSKISAPPTVAGTVT